MCVCVCECNLHTVLDKFCHLENLQKNASFEWYVCILYTVGNILLSWQCPDTCDDHAHVTDHLKRQGTLK